MRVHYASKSGLFLIELIISIFFFILAAAVILQLFVKSHLISERTISINNALLYTQNISEVFLANNGDFTSVHALYHNEMTDISNIADQNVMLMLFDKDWTHTTDIGNAKYSVLADYMYDVNFNYIMVYVNELDFDIMEHISSGDYKSALLDNGHIYHQKIEKYLPNHILNTDN